MKKKFQLEVPGGADKVLLHTCCAPCSSAIIECMMQHHITPVIYYCNPNIYPLEEYMIRKDECTRYAQSLGLEIIDADYDHENWRCHIAGMEQEPERGGRCLRCFKLRLLETARYAHEHGLSVITTTLASSRWKVWSRLMKPDNMPPLHTRMSHTGNRIGGKADLANDVSPLLKSITSTTNNIAVVNSA